MPPYILRLAFMIEFLVALVAIFETWSIVGGQSHLDLMPWYAKLGFVMGLALVTVMATAAAVSHEHAWNAKTIACVLLALMLAAGMGGTTYYFHLHENDDQASGGDDNSITLLYPRELVR
jgi:peptidoglycan/LPS O-acetylase OafA/YrhL